MIFNDDVPHPWYTGYNLILYLYELINEVLFVSSNTGAKVVGVKTDSAAVSLAGARIALRVRTAVLDGDWGAVDEVIHSASDDIRGLAVSVQDLNVGSELSLVKGELEDKVVKAELLEGMRVGCLFGDVGTMQVRERSSLTEDI